MPVAFKHNLRAGDHVFRWTSIILYPIQVHGIVLSTGEGIVTIVDFGLSASLPKSENEDDVDHDINRVVQHCDEYHEENVARGECSRNLTAGDQWRRVSIVVLSEENDIKRWKRIDYGEPRLESEEETLSTNTSKKSWWPWSTNTNTRDEKIKNDKQPKLVDEMKRKRPDPENKASSSNQSSEGEHRNTQQTPPTVSEKSKDNPRCKSDPPFLVLARARYIMMNPDILPSHHVIFSNSECIAVWCKTGRWSTFQASFFLQSSAVGQIKSAVTIAAYVGSQTVPVTVPATGILGWLGEKLPFLDISSPCVRFLN